ncbi:S49 family peptidase [Beggiatoa leptomitoformis]|uniref:S49 family peptidase n=1 Tax=Beggiatoa leptomitoformis TaxID=288004 RepID=A0A2N9YI95_9GAMM|nr:S49 family peptidase [Beggiatoa leptomitoformis]ALG67554.1 S49 family peptidase [Beggiatoa leptomitoformis]AUI70220.1 S49 family peptidase [Beggiatoa leptomitoformis]
MSIIMGAFRLVGQVVIALLSLIILFVLAVLFFVSLGAGLGTGLKNSEFSDLESATPQYTYISGSQQSKQYLLKLSVNGVILGSPTTNLDSFSFLSSGVTYGYQIQEALEAAAKNPNIKGILLHFQTPGGTIYGSRAIFEGVKTYQKATNNPVLAYIEGFSASGGVMAMVGANEIYADYGSMIGSIGVLGVSLTYFNKPVATDGGLMGGGMVTQGGIEQYQIFAGRGKDLGNPFRRPTEEELKNLQAGVETEYNNFVHHVAENRKIDETVIRDKMGAQIFSNDLAKQYGLIDGTLSRQQAIEKLAELAHVQDDYQLVYPQSSTDSWLGQLLAWSTGHAPQVTTSNPQQQLCATILHVPLVYHGNINKVCQ